MENKERIEKEAIQYEDKNPYDAIHSAYFMGAITEHKRLMDFIIWFYRKQFGYTSDNYAKKAIDDKMKEYKSAIERAKANLSEP